MIDKIFVRPVLAVGTFIKRNPLLAALLLVILFLLPPLMVALFTVTRWIVDLVSKIIGVEAAAKLGTAIARALDWMANNHWGCPLFAIAIGMFSPLVGGLLAAWCFVDKFKTGATLTVLPTPTTPAQPGETEVEPDLTDARPTEAVDEYFGGYA